MDSNGSSRVSQLLEKLIDNVLGDVLSVDDKSFLLNKAARHLEEDAPTTDYSNFYTVRDAIYTELQHENPETAVRFLNATARLYENLETRAAYLRYPGEALALLRLIKSAQSETRERTDQQRSRYLHHLPDTFPNPGRRDSPATHERPRYTQTPATETTDPERMSAREILWNIHKNQTPSNRQILRELPYTLQGISSSAFTWVEPLPPDPARAQKTSDGDVDIEDDDEDDDEQTTTVLALPTHLPWQKIGQLSRLMEPAVLYRNIKEELQRREKASETGLVLQALDSAIDGELRSYLALVGVVETEVRRQEMKLQAPDAGVPKDAREYGIGGRMTLTRSIVLLQEATQGLRLVRMILEETRGLVGGQILSLVHAYTHHGDEFVAKFAQRLVPQVARPFFDMLSQWMLSGQLVDPHKEFFIRRTNSGGNSAEDTNPWDGTFHLAEAYIPDYISREVAEQIFQIGKTLHFIAGACDDREWVDERRALARLDPGVLQLPDSQLREEVSETYERVVSHLNDLLRNKFHLDAHLRGLKDYLLLGKGDFVQLLVESVAPVLERPALQLFRHHLTATLETAVRGSNARYDHPDVLRALDARMLELGHGDIGWDVFTLDYRVEEPLNAVIWDHKSMKEYLRVFNFLWRIKRVSFTLNTTWRQLTLMDRAATRTQYLRHPSETTAANRMMSSNSTGSYKSSVYGLYHPLVGGLWQGVRDMCSEMVHFVSELEYYINYEVVEMAWGELTRRLDTGDLSVDEIAAAHREYLRTITHKGLLGGGDFLMGELHSLLKIVLAFGVTCEGLHDVSERLRAQTLGANSSADPGSSILKRVKKIDATLTDLRSRFQTSLRRLVQALGRQEDSEMRFLAVRLNFNGFYS